ncbi:MAG: hypothetical protein AB7T74_03060 [Clostridia bacterium]
MKNKPQDADTLDAEAWFSRMIDERINPECTVTGRLDRLERLLGTVFDRLEKLEADK